jgi:tetratricopeptide (TPR) repeat protein
LQPGHSIEGNGHFQKAIAIKRDYAEAFNNLGVAHYYRGQPKEALASYDQAIRLKPDFADARWNRSLVLLQNGNLKEGFKEYEWRYYKSNWKVIYPYRYKIPRWDGSRFNGRRLYVHDEQGLGDTLQFIRYLPFIRDRGGAVILEAKKPLHRLLNNFPGIDQLVQRSADRKPLKIWISSLPSTRL